MRAGLYADTVFRDVVNRISRSLKVSIDGSMTSAALILAKKHVYNVCKNSAPLELARATTKDELGSSLTEATLSLKVFPVRFNPYDREVLEKISWAENTDIICYVPKLLADNMSVTTAQIKSRYSEFRYKGKTYDIKYVENYSAFLDDFLYIIIGGKS